MNAEEADTIRISTDLSVNKYLVKHNAAIAALKIKKSVSSAFSVALFKAAKSSEFS